MKKSLLALILLSSCSSQGVDRAEQHVITKYFYASVASVKEVELSSEVQSAMVGGAIVGTLDQLDGNREEIIAGGIIGALFSGLITSIFEGGNKAYEYSLSSEQEGDFTFVQKELISTDSGCVRVKMSAKVTISTAENSYCNA